MKEKNEYTLDKRERSTNISINERYGEYYCKQYVGTVILLHVHRLELRQSVSSNRIIL